jgi:predicted lipoprotein with Yx(FWY)xxD motif
VTGAIIQPRRHAVLWWTLLSARTVIAAGLAVDAYVHFDLASLYAESGGTVNEGVLFRVEAVVAVLAAVAIIASGRLVVVLAGLAVAGSALTVMLVSRYVSIGTVGPFPNLYDPVWYPEKLLAAFAEAVAAVTALAAVAVIVWTRRARDGRPPQNLPTGNCNKSNRRNISMTSEFSPAARGRLSRLSFGTGLAAVAATALLAACSSGGSTAAASGGASQSGAASGTMVATSQVSGAGTVLTNESGITVYEAQQEAGGKILCTSSCLSFWMPVTVGQGVTPHAASSVTGKIGTIKRPDGGTQLTVNGHPLYTFKQDNGPGSDMGNNYSDSFGGQSFTWHALTAAGAAASTGAGSGSSGGSTGGSNPYGY